MNRKDFLRSISLAGAVAVLDAKSLALPHLKKGLLNGTCVLIPTETAGPFPLDLSANPYFFRQDIREGKAGVPLRVKLRIIGKANCLPMPNVRVNIWHCDKDGLYSGYSQPNNPGQAGLTYLRGYQITDSNGEVQFITIFPGWYTGRICHIHFQVYVSSSYAAISQLTFPIAAKNALYQANPTLYTKGIDPLNYHNDNIFADGYAYQLATLEPAPDINGYQSFLEVTVQGSGTSSIGYIEKENAKNFQLGQNAPNPFRNLTYIPLHLNFPAEVLLSLWNLNGQQVAVVLQDRLAAGSHRIPVSLGELGLPAAHYAYQIEVRNENGVYRDVRLMSHLP